MSKQRTKKKKKKKIEAPVVVHSKSDKAQGEWMRQTMQDTVKKFADPVAGKGSRPRTNINSKEWQENAADLFSFKPFWERRKEQD